MCKCCETINFWKNEAIKSEYVEDKMFARIAIISWRKGERKIIQNARGETDTKAFNLNYCPMCGRKLGGSNE